MIIVARYGERPESRQALQAAIEEAKRHDARLVVAQPRPERPGDNQSQVSSWVAKLERLREEGTELEQQLSREGVTSEFHLLDDTGESPGSQVLSLARDREADLIVIGVRRRSPVGKLVLGSASQEILLRAECPVLAVKAPAE